MLKDIDLSNAFKKSETDRYKYNSKLDINKCDLTVIDSDGKINGESIQDIVVERKNEGRKEKISISFLVPSGVQDNETIVIKGEGNRRKDERGNLNIKVKIPRR